MRRNSFSEAVKQGAGVALGCYLMSVAIDVVKKPAKRAKLKNGFKNIKGAFNKKTES